MRPGSIWLSGLLLFAAVSVGLGQGKGKSHARPSTSAHIMIAPDAVKWVAPPAGMIQGIRSVEPGGTLQYAVLEGDPTKPGQPFTIELGFSDGYKSAPHWHPTDENIVVLQGTFALATGDTYDPAALHDMSAGSYGFMPKRVPHFGLSKGEMRLLVYGTGPFIINFIGSAGAAQKKPAAK